ncbi:MAG TPA: hypothetical protein DIS98_15665 [Colwellia sp.]|nr:hypothetical protein [Colwellia sp.]
MRRLLLSNKILPLVIIILGGVFAYLILNTGEQQPKGYKKKAEKRIRIVQTHKLEKGSVVPVWNASGSVIPAESVKIYARVSGNIAEINVLATPGGVINKGQWLAKLETIDFELALKSQQAQLEQAQANFSLEQADQILAQEELKLLGNSDGLVINQSLVLREPQLTVAKAKVAVATNNVEKAALNLARTTVMMPFDGKVVSKNIGQGGKVSSNTLLFSVINTDVYWLEVKIPHKFLAIFDKKKLASLSQSRLWGEGTYRPARFISILPELDEKDRQVKVLLAIDAPQSEETNQPQVFINDFLNVQLQGNAINNAWTIKHPWLQPDNTIWVVDQNSTLQKRAVEVLFKARDVIYVRTKIQPGDRALAEKPGIASIGLTVKTRKTMASKIKQNQEQNQFEISPTERLERQNKKQQKNRKLQGLADAS